MRWLLVTPEFPPQVGGGIITFYEELVPALAAQGCDVTVLVGSHVTSGLGSSSWNGVPVRSLEMGEAKAAVAGLRGLEPFPELRRAVGAAWALRRRAAALPEPDLVEVVDWGLLFLPWVLDPPPRSKVIVQLHGSMGQIAAYDGDPRRAAENSLIRLLEASTLQLADELQAYGGPNANFWESAAGRPVTKIYPAYGTRLGSGAAERTGSALVVGRVQRWKGPQVLCAALRRDSQQISVRWIGREAVDPLTGTGFGGSLAREFPDVWGVSITPVGPQPRKAVDEELRSCRYLIVPSLWDTFNFTAVEAMAAACPVICSRGAGAADLIEDGRNGLLAEPGDPISLKEAIQQMEAHSQTARSKMGEAARETVRALLDPSRIAAQRLRRAEELGCTERTQPRSNWGFDGLVSPAPPTEGTLAFLDQFPLRDVARYAASRGVRKLSRKT